MRDLIMALGRLLYMGECWSTYSGRDEILKKMESNMLLKFLNK